MAAPDDTRGCLDVDEVLAFLDGALSTSVRSPLEAHLAQCPACRALVSELARPEDTQPQELSTTVPDRVPGPPKPLLPGQRLGRYEIVRPLGAGAVGQVFLATDPALKRAVAIKLLHQATAHAPFLEREAQALARLRHPNVLAVHDVGGLGSRPFVALEYVQGQTLTEWLKTPRSVGQILDVFRQAGEGLAAAHAAGLVHRDFKPDNVLVGEDGVAKVSDFGLARAPASSKVRLTGVLSVDLSAEHGLIGTPLYMSAEVLAGRPADARSDQFSFCVSLWEALAGERPFPGPHLPSLRAQVLAGPPKTLPANHRMPPWLRPILARGLSPDPLARHPSMTSLLRAIEHARARRTETWRRIHKLCGTSALACLLALSVSWAGLLDGATTRAREWLEVATQLPWSEQVRVVMVSPNATADDEGAASPLALARVMEALAHAGARAVLLGPGLGDGFSQTPRAQHALLRAAQAGLPMFLATPCARDPRPPPAGEEVRAARVTVPSGSTPARRCLHLALPGHPVAPLRLAQSENARSTTGALEGTYALVDVGGVTVPTLALAAFAYANGYSLSQDGPRLTVGKASLAVDGAGVVRTRFRVPGLSQLWSFADLAAALPATGPARLPEGIAQSFQGRYVLLGSAAESVRDPGLFADGSRAPPIWIQGQLLCDLLEGVSVHALNPLWAALLALAFALIAGLGPMLVRRGRAWSAPVVALLGTLGLSLLFARAGVQATPLTWALSIGLAFAGSAWLRTAWAPGTTGDGRLGGPTDGARIIATVLVAHHREAIRGEGPPEAAMARTRRLLAQAVDQVAEAGGRLDHARPELLIALFASGGRSQHARAAAAAAQGLTEAGWTCAVATGEVVVGDGATNGLLGPAVSQAVALLAAAADGALAFNPEAQRRTGIRRALPVRAPSSAHGRRG